MSKLLEDLKRAEDERTEQQKKADESADALLWALMQTGELKTLVSMLKPRVKHER